MTEKLLPQLELPVITDKVKDKCQAASVLTRPGNTKLGKTPSHFSLPAVYTCPGRSATCAEGCYATKGHYRQPSVKDRYWVNHLLRLEDNFVDRICGQIAADNVKLFRIHPSGDFDTPEYIEKWHQIISKRKTTDFWAYTRSWRVPELLPKLDLLSRLPNFQLWFSADKDTGQPPAIADVPVAYMASDDDDNPQWHADLVFRVKRKTKLLTQNQTLVCPAERFDKFKRPNGKMSKQVTCDSCGLCFQAKRVKWLKEFNEMKRIAEEELSSEPTL